MDSRWQIIGYGGKYPWIKALHCSTTTYISLDILSSFHMSITHYQIEINLLEEVLTLMEMKIFATISPCQSVFVSIFFAVLLPIYCNSCSYIYKTICKTSTINRHTVQISTFLAVVKYTYTSVLLFCHLRNYEIADCPNYCQTAQKYGGINCINRHGNYDVIETIRSKTKPYGDYTG